MRFIYPLNTSIILYVIHANKHYNINNYMQK